MSPRKPTPEADQKSKKDDERGIVYHGHEWATSGADGDKAEPAEEHERGVVQNEADQDGDGDEDRDFDNEVTQPGRG